LALVVDGQVYVRAANGPTSSWHRASITHGPSRARVEDRDYDVNFAAAPADVGGADRAERRPEIDHRGHNTR